MTRTNLGRSRVRESRTLGSVGAQLNGLATRPTPRFGQREKSLNPGGRHKFAEEPSFQLPSPSLPNIAPSLLNIAVDHILRALSRPEES